ERDGRADGVDEVDVPAFEIPGRRLDHLQLALGVPDVQNEVGALVEPLLPEPLSQSVDQYLILAAEVDDPHARDVPGRLPPGGERRDERAEGKNDQSNEP